MAQIWRNLQNTFRYHIPDDIVHRVTGNVFDDLTIVRDGKMPGTKKPLTYDRLHEAITAVFRKINETLPGANCIAPSKAFVDKVLKESSLDKVKQIDREEFARLVRKFSHDPLVATCAKEVVLVTVAVFAMAMLTKEAGRRIPKVGNLLAKVPTSIFFVAIALAAVIIVDKFFRTTPQSQILRKYR